jgi:hypothetical protein
MPFHINHFAHLALDLCRPTSDGKRTNSIRVRTHYYERMSCGDITWSDVSNAFVPKIL